MGKIFNNGCSIAILIMLALYAISWIFTCGIIWLITLCFDIEFKLLAATGIWLILCILWPMFRGGNNK